MKWLKSDRARAGAPPPSPDEPADEGRLERLERHLRVVEEDLDDARRRLVLAEQLARGGAERLNAAIDLFEQRLDLIYRQVVGELGHVLARGAIVVETDDSVDRRMAEVLSAGLRVPIDPGRLDIATLLSNDLAPGTLRAPLTLYGFRIDRLLGRETGDAIEIAPVKAGSGGAALFGPYRVLAPGRYRIDVDLSAGTGRGKPAGTVALDVYSPSLDRVVAALEIEAAAIAATPGLSLAFEWPDGGDNRVEFRCHQASTLPLRVAAVTIAAES